MKRNAIAFFSSDARKLYKDDIFRALALPNDYIIHFRYQKKYVEDSIYEKGENLVGLPGVIFFTVGNTIEKEGPKQLMNISIRKVDVEDCYYDEDTDLVHFYLRLGKFTNSVIISSEEKVPDKYFAMEYEINEINEVNWISKVDEVKQYFGDVVFYNIQIIKKGIKSSEFIKYVKQEKQSFYNLCDGENYTLKLSISDNSKGNSHIKINENAGLLAISAPSTIEVGAPKDTQHFRIITHNLDVRNKTTNINFISEPIPQSGIKDSYEVSVGIDISKGLFKPFMFGLLSIMALIGTALLTVAFNVAITQSKIITLIFIISPILLLISSFGLFGFYNKK